jgi:hypothetical protein
MRVCQIIAILRDRYQPLAKQAGLSFSVAPDPKAPYDAILASGSAGMMILVYEGQSRIDDTPRGRIPVGSRFAIFVSASTKLSGDRESGGSLFSAVGGDKPLYEICEDIEDDIRAFEIPQNDGTVEKVPYYESTDPAVMPDGYVLSAYKIAFRIRRAM